MKMILDFFSVENGESLVIRKELLFISSILNTPTQEKQ